MVNCALYSGVTIYHDSLVYAYTPLATMIAGCKHSYQGFYAWLLREAHDRYARKPESQSHVWYALQIRLRGDWSRQLGEPPVFEEGFSSQVSGTMMTYSLGGGTGSGLGSRLLEEVRDLYPKTPLLELCLKSVDCGGQ